MVVPSWQLPSRLRSVNVRLFALLLQLLQRLQAVCLKLLGLTCQRQCLRRAIRMHLAQQMRPTILPNCWNHCVLCAAPSATERSSDDVKPSRRHSAHRLLPTLAFRLALTPLQLMVQPASVQSLWELLPTCPLWHLSVHQQPLLARSPVDEPRSQKTERC